MSSISVKFYLHRCAAVLFLGGMLLIYVAASFIRNSTWQNDAGLWLDTVAKSPFKVRIYYNLGTIYGRMNETETAISWYERGIRLDSNYAPAYINLGALYKKQGNLNKAVELYEAAIRIRPDAAVAYNNLGNALLAKGDVFGAIESFRKAVGIKPDYADAHYNLGLTFFEQGFTKLALPEIEFALRLDPNHAEAGRLLEDMRRRSVEKQQNR